MYIILQIFQQLITLIRQTNFTLDVDRNTGTEQNVTETPKALWTYRWIVWRIADEEPLVARVILSVETIHDETWLGPLQRTVHQ